ncbi:hypothetical protein D3C87_1208400 [compost metagenome]
MSSVLSASSSRSTGLAVRVGIDCIATSAFMRSGSGARVLPSCARRRAPPPCVTRWIRWVTKAGSATEAMPDASRRPGNSRANSRLPRQTSVPPSGTKKQNAAR